MTRKLTKELNLQKTKTEQIKPTIYASLGIPLDGRKLVEVPGRNSYVYARLRDNQNEVIQAFNNKVAASYDLPVTIHREGSRYIIDGVNTQRYQNNWNNFAPYLPKHGQTHSFVDGGGGDVAWIFSRQFMPLLVYPTTAFSSGTSLFVHSQGLLVNNIWKFVGNTGTPDFQPYLPTGSNSVMALVYLDVPSGNPSILVGSGSYFNNSITGTGDVYPYIPIPNLATQIPLAGVRLETGTFALGWNNLYDVREWLHPIPSGTSSGGGTSTGTSFVSTPTYPAIYHDGNFVVSGTQIDFTRNVLVSASGTRATIDLPITTYFRVGQPTPLSTPTGLFWQVPDRVFASGSLGVFVQGHALIPGIDYNEQIYISGTYAYTVAQPTGSYHLVHYGVPCYPQPHIPTGTLFGMVDSQGNLLLDSNGIQIVDSQGN
jgi:hypothetical protein